MRLPKQELQLNQIVVLTLMKDKAYAGESAFGPYFLYQVKDSAGMEYSFFAPAEVHQQILQVGLKAGDSFQLAKKAVQNGKKVSAKLEFEAVKKNGAAPQPQQPKEEDVPSRFPTMDSSTSCSNAYWKRWRLSRQSIPSLCQTKMSGRSR